MEEYCKEHGILLDNKSTATINNDKDKKKWTSNLILNLIIFIKKLSYLSILYYIYILSI